MIIVSFDNNTSGVASGTGTANLSGTPVFSAWDTYCSFVSFLWSVLLIIVVLSYFFVPLYRLPFFDLHLFGTVKLFVDYLSRIYLWDEMWITSTRMVIRGKILIKSNRMNLYCIGRNLCNNLHVKEDIFDIVVPFCIVACIPLSISLLT